MAKKITFKAMPHLNGEAYEVYLNGKYVGNVARTNRQGQGRGWDCNGYFRSSRKAAVAAAIGK